MKKLKAKLLICFAALLAVAATNVIRGQFELPEAKVTVRVLDEDQKPLSNANVWLGFVDRVTRKDVAVRGVTDANGLFTGEGGFDLMSVGCTITKDGYYIGTAPIPSLHDMKEIVNNRWEPWNATYTTILRPVGKPVALFARRVQLKIPALDNPCGFDFESCDWVMPYGKGIKSDLIFTIHEAWNGSYDFDVKGELTFKNALDGIQKASIPDIATNSQFRWVRLAPETGYDATQEVRNAWFPEGSGKKPIRSFKGQDVWQGYFFRVRTVVQDNQIVSAHYGKIRGGIQVYPDSKTGKPNIAFTYYYNPTPNDRNLEWDPKKDLFTGLTDMERPREP